MCIMREVFKVMGQILNFYTTDNRYRGKVNMDVIKFIDTVSSFPSREGNVSDNIDHLFCAEYCYYFANMLQLAFGGTVCYAQDRGHIVWVDCDPNSTFKDLQQSAAYDITGIFEDYEYLFPIEYLGNAISDYKHTNETFHLNQDFKDWCDFYNVTELYAINVIWGLIPQDIILSEYNTGASYVSSAYSYWITYNNDFSRLFEHIKHGMILSGLALHDGILSELECIESKSDPEELCTDMIEYNSRDNVTDKVNDLKIAAGFSAVDEDELTWCRENAPALWSNLSDDELIDNMHDLYMIYHHKDN